MFRRWNQLTPWLVLCGFVVVKCVETNLSAKQQHEVALRYYYDGNMPMSVEHLKASLEIELDPSTAYIWNNGIEIYRKAGQLMEALTLQRELLNSTSPLSKTELEMAHSLVNSLMSSGYYAQVRDFHSQFWKVILHRFSKENHYLVANMFCDAALAAVYAEDSNEYNQRRPFTVDASIDIVHETIVYVDSSSRKCWKFLSILYDQRLGIIGGQSKFSYLHRGILESNKGTFDLVGTDGSEINCVQMLLLHGHDLNTGRGTSTVVNSMDAENRTPLTIAIIVLDMMAATQLLEHGADPILAAAGSQTNFMTFVIEIIRNYDNWGFKKVLNKNKQNPLFQNKIHLRSQELWDRCSFESSLRYSNHGRVYERVLMTDIKTALAPRTREVMNTILTATNNIDEVDRLNRTGLHYAAIFGDLTVASVLLQNGADSYRKDKLNNTAEFYAHSQGYADVYKLLSNKTLKAHVPNINLRKVRREVEGDSPESGGWATEKLESFDSIACNISEVDASELNESWFFEHYVVKQQPLMIRNYNISDWPAIEKWTKGSMRQLYGKREHHLGIIPYSELYGGRALFGPLKLKDYIDAHMPPPRWDMEAPLYWFEAIHDAQNEVVRDSRIPMMLSSQKGLFYTKTTYWQHFVGPAGSGSGAHLHDDAWNTLVYGRERWFLWPPGMSFTSNMPTIEWLRSADWRETSIPFHCTQNAGDILLVPRNWGHATLGIMENVGMASEFSLDIVIQ